MENPYGFAFTHEDPHPNPIPKGEGTRRQSAEFFVAQTFQSAIKQPPLPKKSDEDGNVERALTLALSRKERGQEGKARNSLCHRLSVCDRAASAPQEE